MSQLHFTAAPEYRRRVIQLGESPERVLTVGALGLDAIRGQRLLSKQELERELGFIFDRPILLVTFHPESLEKDTLKHFRALLGVLHNLSKARIIFTYPNADAHGREMAAMIRGFVRRNPGKALAFASLGSQRYLSLLRFVDAVVGNSSSGIIEVPFFKKPTVNIGDRQRGRVMAESVICCPARPREISTAIGRALSAGFRKRCRESRNLYGNGTASRKICARVAQYLKRPLPMKKKFFDVCVRGSHV
jgi:GDP/UDP-N,N'-diacetylbacillosamine 2-epimerase (hydrolysing)